MFNSDCKITQSLQISMINNQLKCGIKPNSIIVSWSYLVFINNAFRNIIFQEPVHFPDNSKFLLNSLHFLNFCKINVHNFERQDSSCN